MKVVAGRKTELKTKSETIVAMLRDLANAIEAGKESATDAIVMFKDSSDVETSYTSYVFTGKSTEILGLMELIKFRIITEDMAMGD